MPTVDEIRNAIKAKIDGVANAGTVHTYQRYAEAAPAFQAFYKDAPSARIKGWHIRRLSTREKFIDVARWEIFHHWRIVGYFAIDDADASEKLFDTLIEQIRDAFRQDDDLNGLIFTSINPQNNEAGLQLIEHIPVRLAGVLCHKAELSLTTQHLHP